MQVRIREVLTQIDDPLVDIVIRTGIIPRVGETIQLKIKHQSMYDSNTFFRVTKVSHIINIDEHVSISIEVVRKK